MAKNMQIHNDNNDSVFSIFVGMILGVGSYILNNDVVINFSLELLKVCLFGFAGGVFGLIGKRLFEKLTKKK